MSRAPSVPSDLLDGALRRNAAAPLVTSYDDATGERVELSAATLANSALCLVNQERSSRGLRPLRANRHLAKVGSVEIEQSVPGRILGYGTVVAGDLEIRCVARPRELCGLVQRLSS